MPQPPGLLARTLRALKITTSVTALKTLVDMGAQIALLRLLVLPELFGILAFFMAAAGFVSCMADWGGGRYLIQKKNLEPRHTATIFTTEIFAGVAFALIWLLAAPLLLRLLGKAHLVGYAAPFALFIFFERLHLPRFILEKELHFGKSNIATLTGVIAGAAVALALAARGCGVYSLIIGQIFRSLATAMTLWVFAPVRPALRPDLSLVSPYIRFGLPLTISGLLSFYTWNVDYIIVGRLMGEQRLGFYYNAFRFAHYIMHLQALVSTVIYPAFAQTPEKDRLLRGFNLATRYSAAIAFAPCLAVLVFGRELILYIIGEKWLPALLPLQIFTCLAAFRMITVHWYDAYISRGRTGVMPLLGVVNAVGVTFAAWLGARQGRLGAVAVGVALVNTAVILFAVNVLLKKIIPVRYLSILWRPVLAGMAGLAVLLILRRLPLLPSSPMTAFAIKLSLGMVFYAAVFAFLDRREILALARHAL